MKISSDWSSEHSHAPDAGTIIAARRCHDAICSFNHRKQHKQCQSLEMLLLGQVVVPKKTYRMTDDRVSSIVRDYASRTFTEFLRVIAHNLRF